MRKHISCLILAFLLMVNTALPVIAYAEEETTHPDRLQDFAQVLTEEEASSLRTKLDEISEKHQVDVAILTDLKVSGDLQDSVDIYYEESGYGFGPDHDGIIFALLVEDRKWCISTQGFGMVAFTIAGQEYITDKMLPAMQNDDFNEALNIFADNCDDFIEKAKSGDAYDTGNLPKGRMPISWIVGGIILGFVVAFIQGTTAKSKMISVINQENATSYQCEGSVALRQISDKLLNTFVTTRRINNSSDSSGSGSGSHKSSSGTTHGGSTGSF